MGEEGLREAVPRNRAPLGVVNRSVTVRTRHIGKGCTCAYPGTPRPPRSASADFSFLFCEPMVQLPSIFFSLTLQFEFEFEFERILRKLFWRKGVLPFSVTVKV